MAYHIELEDHGQDLIHLTVDDETGEITDAGLHSHLYADGNHFVIVEDLYTYRDVRFRRGRDGEVHSFFYPMTKLTHNDTLLASV